MNTRVVISASERKKGVTARKRPMKPSEWHPEIGDIVPDFSAQATFGPLQFHEWSRGSWVYFCSHPAAFTPICTTEMVSLAKHQAEFDRRGIKVLALSADTAEDQWRWMQEMESTFGTHFSFPLVADPELSLSKRFGMYHRKESSERPIRRSFFIDPTLRLRMMFDYPMNIGRKTDEVLRVFDALIAADRLELGTPADWEDGEPYVVLPDETDEHATQRLHTRLARLMSYLRLVSPGKNAA
ncbi:3-Cys thioredoxin peroxidase [Rhodovulum adriaticum]|uniref:Thioredoxin peroxidase n=2 Tax=Rhodovulum adriaticum TaxID=35804 RepID=A0A4R2NMB6_RHOAD|nr:3-Cys thioredoxin peroxidase [Rhodovulum adriaticum]